MGIVSMNRVPAPWTANASPYPSYFEPVNWDTVPSATERTGIVARRDSGRFAASVSAPTLDGSCPVAGNYPAWACLSAAGNQWATADPSRSDRAETEFARCPIHVQPSAVAFVVPWPARPATSSIAARSPGLAASSAGPSSSPGPVL